MSILFDPGQVPLGRPGEQVGVMIYVPNDGFYALPTVIVTTIAMREGPHWSTAEFEYLSGNMTPQFDPIYFEDVLPIKGQYSDYIASVDDLVVVVRVTPDGSLQYLFYGFVMNPGTQFTADSYAVGFQAVGVERRCWDDPMPGAWHRDCTKSTDATRNVLTALQVRFNPLGKPNMSPQDADMTIDGLYASQTTPVFIDKTFAGKDDEGKLMIRSWTLRDVARYIVLTGNQVERYVANPYFTTLDALLDVYTPKEGVQYVDPEDPDTYDENPIEVADADVSDMVWPEALAGILDKYQFSMCFRLRSDSEGNPQAYLDVYKKIETNFAKYKDLFLDQWGNDLDPTANNLQVSDLQRDMSKIVNKVTVKTAPEVVEATFVLAPLFPIAPGDQAQKTDYLLSSPNFTGDARKKYRWWGIGDRAEGYWDMRAWQWVPGVVLDLTPIFPAKKATEEGQPDVPSYVPRPRPPKSQILTRDEANQRKHPQLFISCDYAGDTPSVWDGSGTWYEIAWRKSWAVLDDRCGILLNCQNPNSWNIDKIPGIPWFQLASGAVRAVDWLQNNDPPAGNTPGAFYLMLNCMIEGDQAMDKVANKRPVSPTRFTVHAAVDMRSEFQPGRIWKGSYNATGRGDEGSEDTIVDYDEKRAQSVADAKREALQFGRYSTRAEVPRLTTAYAVGDRIRSVNGRSFDMKMNLTGGIELPVYPKVVAIQHLLKEKQRTVLVLADTAIVRVARRRHR